MDDILAGYAAASADLIERFEAISTEEVFTPVSDLLPQHPCRIADIGAGTGRDAAWFARLGHRVLAVEPVTELRTAGMSRHAGLNIEWLDDRLPTLASARTKGSFDLITLCAVWQHLSENARPHALENIAQMIAPCGLIIMSLRHGEGAADRRTFPICVEETVEQAGRCGLSLLRQVSAQSVQPANRASGVHWTWLVMQAGESHGE